MIEIDKMTWVREVSPSPATQERVNSALYHFLWRSLNSILIIPESKFSDLKQMTMVTPNMN